MKGWVLCMLRVVFSLGVLFCLGNVTPLCADDIGILHGSFAANSRWPCPGGKFFEEVKKRACTVGGNVHPIQWSGGITPQCIIQAASDLVTTFFTSNFTIFFAHSNGGNVLAYFSMLLDALYKAQEDERIRGIEQVHIPESIRAPFFEKVITRNRVTASQIPPKIDQLITDTFLHLRTVMKECHPRRSLSDYPVKLMCFMGTPINTKRFDVKMNVVAQVINLYSVKDHIQTVVGDQTLPAHERRANVRARIQQSGNGQLPYDPCHKNIRHHLIGKWLLDLPSLLSEQNNAAPYNLKSGAVVFYEDKLPDLVEIGQSSVVDSSLSLAEALSIEEDFSDDNASSDWAWDN